MKIKKVSWGNGPTFNETMGAGSSPRLHKFTGKARLANVRGRQVKAERAAIRASIAAAQIQFGPFKVPACGQNLTYHADGFVRATLNILTN